MTGVRGQDGHAAGRLAARPAMVAGGAGESATGVRALGLATARDALLYVPTGHRAGTPIPLVVALHGAGGVGQHGLDLLLAEAEARTLLLLAPTARRATWDLLGEGYGPDVALLDRALATVFARHAVDPARLALSGFSDGASYALSVGLANGDVFGHVLAFSPGFAAPGGRAGRPPIFVSHGTHDRVLPIERCSRRIVPQLRRAGYEVRYREFDGPHTVPPGIVREGLDWFLG
jgi:phospholipase/carboxylesterase